MCRNHDGQTRLGWNQAPAREAEHRDAVFDLEGAYSREITGWVTPKDLAAALTEPESLTATR